MLFWWPFATRVLHPSGDRCAAFSDSEGIVGSTEGNISVNTRFGVDCQAICHYSVICDPIDDCEKWKNGLSRSICRIRQRQDRTKTLLDRFPRRGPRCQWY